MDEGLREKLEEAACEVRARAYAPYSQFRVGAAVLGGSGAIYRGVNVENASYGLTICAERSAIVQALSAGEKTITAVAVCTENGVTPCGACRQVMREFMTADSPVYIMDAMDRRRATTMEALLPQSFGQEDLDAADA